MCELFKNHLTSLGYRSPSTLVAKMFKYMHEHYCHASDPPTEAQNSNARVASPAHDNADDGGVDAVPAEDEAPLPSQQMVLFRKMSWIREWLLLEVKQL